jgi:hypothetical protein
MRIGLIGRGTVGCLAMIKLVQQYGKDHELVWAYDPDISPAAVGEGTTASVPSYLGSGKFVDSDLISVNGTIKRGIYKENWGTKHNSFVHDFDVGSNGIHMNAVELQDLVFNKLKREKIKHVEKHLSVNDMDCDYVFVATGMPKDTSNDYQYLKTIPVNSCFVSQCPWEDRAKDFTHTLTIARPYGWIFGIPLENRISIGYCFNQNINSLEEIK